MALCPPELLFFGVGVVVGFVVAALALDGGT